MMDLEEAECLVRRRAQTVNGTPDMKQALGIVLAEMDRLRAIEKAATALLEHWHGLPLEVQDAVGYADEETQWLTDALAAVVGGLSSSGGA